MDIINIIQEEVRRALLEQKKVSFKDFISNIHDGSDASLFEVPMLDDKLKKVLQQFISLVSEVRESGIDSKDFINVDNLGIKTNGNLGVFDLGFGDYYSSFNQEPEGLDLNEETMLDKIKSKMGIEKSSFIGKGMFGPAHDIGDGKVMKITSDKSEAVNAMKVKGKTNNHIADVYDVKKFNTDRDKEFFVIILEKLDLKPEIKAWFNELEKAFNDSNDKHIDKSVLEKINNPLLKGFLYDLVEKGREKAWSAWLDQMKESGLDDKYDLNDIADISEWIKGSVENDNDPEETPPKYISDLLNSI